MDPFANVQTAATSNRVRVIFFDMDGTLIKPRLGGRFPKSETDWMWLYPEVPKRIAEEVKDGRHVVVLSNQGSGRPKLIAEWKKKLRLICESVSSLLVLPQKN
jgi:bifunctional polynucleotide phosphatase/kinase